MAAAAQAGLITMAASPYALHTAFGPLPPVSSTARRRLDARRRDALAVAAGSGRGRRCARLPCSQLSTVQWQLAALAFAASCAGNGMIVSTLGAVLASHSVVDGATGRQTLQLGATLMLDTATCNGLLLGARWGIECARAARTDPHRSRPHQTPTGRASDVRRPRPEREAPAPSRPPPSLTP